MALTFHNTDCISHAEKDQYRVRTPDHSYQRNKRKNAFGASSCEKEKKLPAEMDSSLYDMIYDEFPPVGDTKIEAHYTPENLQYRSWADIMDMENEKENNKETDGCKSGSKPDSSFRPRRKLSLSSLSGKDSKEKRDSGQNKTNFGNFKKKEILTDLGRLEKRQRQIDIGKNTLEYGNFLRVVPRSKRKKEHPSTPDKFQMCSTRSWQGQMRIWRRNLHLFDSPEAVADHLSRTESILRDKSGSDDKDEESFWISKTGVSDTASVTDVEKPKYNMFTPL